MSLMDTFVQVFEFDTRQADGAFDRVQRSTDDIIDGMKQAQTAAQQGLILSAGCSLNSGSHYRGCPVSTLLIFPRTRLMWRSRL